MKGVLIVVVVAFAGTLLYAGGNIFYNRGATNTVIAKVNGQAIKAQEFEKRYLDTVRYYEQYQGTIPNTAVEELRYYTLQQLINNKLMLQKARQAKIKVTKDEINAEIAAIKENFVTDEEYEYWLSGMGLTDAELRTMISENLAVEKLYDSITKVEITEEDIKKAYEQVKASHILIEPVSDNWEAARMQAERVRNEILKGKSFEELAKTNSADFQTKDMGGNVGYFGRDAQMDPNFIEAAFKLKVGEISEPVRTSYGYHLIKVTERIEAEGEEFENAKESIKAQLEARAAETRFTEWYQQVMADAKIVVNDPALRARQFVANNQLPQAVSQYQEAIEKNPSDPYLHLSLASVYKQLDDPDRSLRELEEAVRLGYTDAELHLILGMEYMDRKMNDKAAQEFRTASGLDLYNYSLHYQLKELFNQLDLPDDVKVEEERMQEIIAAYEAQQKAYEAQQKAYEEQMKALEEAQKSQTDDSGSQP
ncbi:MAG TPA: tetratricopeptide repeat protein [Firmicutes bacterium]|nr:tetratricopeptide repeat protein [Bacillota bacterium]